MVTPSFQLLLPNHLVYCSVFSSSHGWNLIHQKAYWVYLLSLLRTDHITLPLVLAPWSQDTASLTWITITGPQLLPFLFPQTRVSLQNFKLNYAAAPLRNLQCLSTSLRIEAKSLQLPIGLQDLTSMIVLASSGGLLFVLPNLPPKPFADPRWCQAALFHWLASLPVMVFPKLVNSLTFFWLPKWCSGRQSIW